MKTLIPVLLTFLLPTVATAAPVLNPANGHYYEFVSSSLDWEDAKVAAETMSHAGEPGYLATITSADENEFVFSTFATGLASSGAWMGGEDGDMDGTFYWAGGPEMGVQFSSGSAPTAPFNYANWGGIEPNLDPTLPTYSVMNLGTAFASVDPGEWWDAPNINPADPVIGYIVEFSEASVPVQNSSWGAIKQLFE